MIYKWYDWGEKSDEYKKLEKYYLDEIKPEQKKMMEEDDIQRYLKDKMQRIDTFEKLIEKLTFWPHLSKKQHGHKMGYLVDPGFIGKMTGKGRYE